MRYLLGLFLALFVSVSVFGHLQQKTIKDSAEYNAYVTAINLQDPAKKAAAMEDFVIKYPDSIVKVDALEQAMAAYQATNNTVKVGETADRILQIDSNHVRALAIATFLRRNKATSGDSAALKEMTAYAERGLKLMPDWTKPETLSDAEFKSIHSQIESVFYGASAFAMLQSKDYAHARDYYLKSIQTDPNNFQDIYQLSIADLEMKPMDIDGFWYIARAVNLQKGNAQAQQSILNYAKAKYKNYHGGDDGWDQIVASAADATSPPSGFSKSIKPRPTPADIAVKAVEENDPATMSFSDWEYILSYRDASPANKQAADRVWKALQDKEKNGAAKLSMPVILISATKDTIEAAITEDNQSAKKADLHIVLQKPLASVPAPGTQIQIIGVLTSYTTNPFMFVMEKAEIAK